MKYEITKEQLQELAKGNAKVERWFPDAFETKLEVGKWYKSNDVLNHIFYVTKLFDGKYFYYGFNSAGNYVDDDYYLLTDFGLRNGFTNATESEVFEALKKEAVKIGLVNGAEYISHFGNKRAVAYPLKLSNDGIDLKDSLGWKLTINGKWVTPIKEKTLSKSEAEAKLNELIKDGYTYKID